MKEMSVACQKAPLNSAVERVLAEGLFVRAKARGKEAASFLNAFRKLTVAKISLV